MEKQYGWGDARCPQGALCTNSRLRDVGSAHDFVGDSVDLLLFIPRAVGVKVNVQGSGQHLGSQLFGVVTGLIVGFTKRMVFAEISVGAAVSGKSHPDAGGHQTVE